MQSPVGESLDHRYYRAVCYLTEIFTLNGRNVSKRTFHIPLSGQEQFQFLPWNLGLGVSVMIWPKVLRRQQLSAATKQGKSFLCCDLRAAFWKDYDVVEGE